MPKSKELTARQRVKSERFREITADLLYSGRTPGQIAEALYPEDSRERRRMRDAIQRMSWEDQLVQERITRRAHGEMIQALGRVTRALIRRAERGRPDAIKLLYEASGFHNPRVKHDHSGDITVTIQGIPRPPDTPALAEPSELAKADSTEDGQEIVDAEVVEEVETT